MKGERLKYPLIASQLYELKLDIEDWMPQIVDRVGLGIWSFGKIKNIVKEHLERFDLWLAEINGLKLKKAERIEFADYRKFCDKTKDIMQNPRKKK